MRSGRDKLWVCPDDADPCRLNAYPPMPLPSPRIDEPMAWTQQEVRELKEGRYMLVDEEPCRILSIQTSKPGKHGEAKARIDAVGLFDGSKRSVVYPVKHKVQVPLIGKKNAQVLSVTEAEVQLMDLENYETFTLPWPSDPDLKAQIKPGGEIQYLEAMGKRRIMRI
jgi:translation initiation factor 5A